MSKYLRKVYDGASGGWVIEKGMQECNTAQFGKGWLADQIKERRITNKLLAIGREEYIVPKMLEIDKEKVRVRQKFISGGMVTEQYFKGLSKQHKNSVIAANALFTADMASLKPVAFRNRFRFWDGLMNDISTGMPADVLSCHDLAYLCESAQAAKDFIDTKPFSQAYVFQHGDNSYNNVLYDKKKRRMGVIDFEAAGIGDLHGAFAMLLPDMDPALESMQGTVFANEYPKVFQSISAANFKIYDFVQDFYIYGSMFLRVRKRDYHKNGFRNIFAEMVKSAKIIEKSRSMK
ncbi:MAG: aminoglycoside phosphotransferase family protein [Rickettsiales bacterium]|jgi:hypothetical protein|nr:aminoglycoside phosphotransferase family protein [Rickettsiales bacterium]